MVIVQEPEEPAVVVADHRVVDQQLQQALQILVVVEVVVQTLDP